MEWIDAKNQQPPLIEGKDYSENVLSVLNGRLAVMAYCFIPDDDNLWFYTWANCYGDVNGDPEWDDDYQPTHWMPLPALPKKNDITILSQDTCPFNIEKIQERQKQIGGLVDIKCEVQDKPNK